MKWYKYSFSLMSCSLIWSIALMANAHANSQRDNDAMSSYRAGTEHYKQRKYKEAAEAFKKAIELNADYAEAHRDLGNSYFSLGEYWKAYEGTYQVSSNGKPLTAQIKGTDAGGASFEPVIGRIGCLCSRRILGRAERLDHVCARPDLVHGR